VTNVPEYAMVTEARDTTLCCIAVMCHELGHLVGLPDLYDGSRNTWGVGYWGLMGYGAWGAGGNTPWSPSHMEAWSKVTAGFVTPVVITQDTHDLRMLDVETHPVVYKIWRDGRNSDTCFLLENRQQKGFDTPLPGHGLLVWHIDRGAGSMHNVVDLEEDSTFHLDRGNGVRPDPHVYHQALGDTSDALPGNWNRTFFDNSTVPNSRARNGSPTNVAIRYVREVGDTIVCDIAFGNTGSQERPEAGPVSDLILRGGPSPFRGRVELELEAPGGGGPPELAIYDRDGQQVWRARAPGLPGVTRHRFDWRGRDGRGAVLPTGIYQAVARCGGKIARQRLVLLGH
jgi:hypothetical protein